MTRKTKSSGRPLSGAPPESVGNQLCVAPVDEERLHHADREAGEARDEERREPGEQRGGRVPARPGRPASVRRARSAGRPARRAHRRRCRRGTCSRTARRFGDRPASIAETSSSDAALVDSPKGVQRYSAASAAATAITIPASMNRSIGTTRPKIVTVSDGQDRRRRFRGCCRRSRSRRTRARAGGRATRPAWRAAPCSGAGGRWPARSATPNAAMQASVRTNAGANERWKPK